MTLPQVTLECLTAVMEKSTQQSPDEFAEGVMVDMLKEQPVLLDGITAVLAPFLEAVNINEHGGVEMTPESRTELMIMGQFCLLGITLKALTAQADAKEMEEVWK